jgi:hypothetical protein
LNLVLKGYCWIKSTIPFFFYRGHRNYIKIVAGRTI